MNLYIQFCEQNCFIGWIGINNIFCKKNIFHIANKDILDNLNFDQLRESIIISKLVKYLIVFVIF